MVSNLAINPRSVLRPEYHDHNERLGTRLNFLPAQNRWGTNTAPIYSVDIPCNVSKRLSPRKSLAIGMSNKNAETSVHRDTFSRHLPNDVGHPAMRSISSAVHFRMDLSSNKMDHKYDSSNYKSSNYSTKYSDTYSSSRRSSDTNNEKNPSISKFSGGTGQAEQVRRSRESNTFALIDEQLSQAPLNQIREMYLQNRCSSSCTNVTNPSRTTKKANLSVVHTVVRFRVGDYLSGLREHLNKLVDLMAENSAHTEFQADSISTFPCKPDCVFCHRIEKRISNSQQMKRQPKSSRYFSGHPYATSSRCHSYDTSPRTNNSAPTSSHSFKLCDSEFNDAKTEQSSQSEVSLGCDLEESVDEDHIQDLKCHDVKKESDIPDFKPELPSLISTKHEESDYYSAPVPDTKAIVEKLVKEDALTDFSDILTDVGDGDEDFNIHNIRLSPLTEVVDTSHTRSFESIDSTTRSSQMTDVMESNLFDITDFMVDDMFVPTNMSTGWSGQLYGGLSIVQDIKAS